ncbi:MAG TPA: hypothetical protein VN256_16325 [Pyrinomonadaceae bacterium]|nr:hypothetical protein [Pyrinomonadaceae bacterium]
MIELFRFFRLGIVNLVGVTLPGLLTLFFLGVGFLAPVVIFVFNLAQRLAGAEQSAAWATAASLYGENKGVIILLVVTLAYVIGYVIRLSTPDELDRISARNVLKKMEEELTLGTMEKLKKRAETSGGATAGAAEEIDEGLSREAVLAAEHDSWPYRGEKFNKFPYYHFKDYLESRGLEELTGLVKWGCPSVEDDSCADQPFKRSKTVVNLMKLEVGLRSPELSAVIESNEAHVRLLYGTWQAITTSRRFVVIGLIVNLLVPLTRFLPAPYPSPSYPAYVLSIIAGGTMFAGMTWAKNRIENLFHYQRVRELTHIVGCFHYVNKYKPPAAGHPPEDKSAL